MLLNIITVVIAFTSLCIVTYWFTRYHEYKDKIELWQYMIEHDYDITSVDWNSLTPKK